MMPGALCVMTAGLILMPVLLADNWATPDLVSTQYAHMIVIMCHQTYSTEQLRLHSCSSFRCYCLF